MREGRERDWRKNEAVQCDGRDTEKQQMEGERKKQEEEKEEAGVLHSWGNFLLVPPQHSLTTTEGVHYSHFTFH